MYDSLRTIRQVVPVLVPTAFWRTTCATPINQGNGRRLFMKVCGGSWWFVLIRGGGGSLWRGGGGGGGSRSGVIPGESGGSWWRFHRCQHQRTKKRDRADEKAKKRELVFLSTTRGRNWYCKFIVQTINGFCPSYDNPLYLYQWALRGPDA